MRWLLCMEGLGIVSVLYQESKVFECYWLVGDSWACQSGGPQLAVLWDICPGYLGIIAPRLPLVPSSASRERYLSQVWVIQLGLPFCQQAMWPGQKFIGAKEFENLKKKI